MKRTLVFFLFCFSILLSGQRFPAKPSPPRLVNDYTSTLSQREQRELENKLVRYNDTTSTQIAVVILQDIGGDDINLYTAELAAEWEIGQKGKDNGLLILLSLDDRKISIQVGYGLEPILTDALSKQIIDNYITPKFRQGNFYAGLDSGTDQIIKVLAGEFKGSPPPKKDKKPFPWIVIAIIAAFFILSFFRKGGGGNRNYRRGGGYWIGGFGSGYSGGGGFGSSGGGFGGFGGGSFGGGGASGSW